MNQVTLIGNIATEIDLRTTQSGKMVAKFNLAVSRGWGDKKKTSFIPCVVWDKAATALADHSGKGKKIAVKGELEIDSVEKDGQRRNYTSVICHEVEFLSPKEQGQAAPAELGDDLPF